MHFGDGRQLSWMRESYREVKRRARRAVKAVKRAALQEWESGLRGGKTRENVQSSKADEE